jgi:tetratricopeptide (TPR) repeat protein
MPVQKLQVFIAGSFEEFADLRHALRDRINRVERPEVEAIDLNDNLAAPHPPIIRCYQAVERADLVVLFVGQTYGEKVAGLGSSYTHLEYKRAQEDHRTVLAYHVDASREEPSDPSVRAWLKEIWANQTVSRLDPALGAERMASDVFEAVLGRLLESLDEGDASQDDDDQENIRGREDSPIKRKELKSCVKPSTPLKALAAAHANQAFDALTMNLPETAIDQLQRAVDLSPLEFVPAYWLARLLIATGRFSDCRKGLRLALRCLSVASQTDDGPDLAMMASLILAARASERLGDSDAALRYAAEAHEGTPWHWMAKVELGRQYALNRIQSEAFKYARDAFWARADTIDKIQSEPAYRDLGQVFDDFRRRLRDEVESETAEVLRVEATLRESVAKRFDDVVESVPSESEPEPGRRSSLTSLVRRAHASGISSLALLKRWADALKRDVNSFASGNFKALTQATDDSIQQSVENETANVASLKEKLKTETKVIERASRQIVNTAFAGLFFALADAGGIWLAISNAQWTAAVILFVLLVIIVWAFLVPFASIWSRRATAAIKLSLANTQLRHAETALVGFLEARREFDLRAGEVRNDATLFGAAVNGFERAVCKRPTIAPVVPRRRAKGNDVFRLDNARAEKEKVIVNRELLPDDFKYLLPDESPPTATHWLATRVGSGTSEILSRSAAYFSS